MIKMEKLTPKAFKSYGTVFENDPKGAEPFQVQFRETSSPGWQVAINRVKADSVDRMHRHLDTHECFSPLWGTTVILVATPESPDEIKAFILDKPIKINASGESQVFVCENAELKSEDRNLGRSISIGMT